MKKIIIALLVASAWQANAQDIAARAVIKIEPLPVLDGRTQGNMYIIDGEGSFQPVTVPKETIKLREPGRYVFTSAEIERMPTMNVNDILSTVPGVYQARRGDAVHIYGGKASGNAYYIDGIRQ